MEVLMASPPAWVRCWPACKRRGAVPHSHASCEGGVTTEAKGLACA